MKTQRIPVIIDTDIGGDIDDTWALAMALKCPQLDIKLIATCTADTTYRAKIAARLLEIAGRTDIPLGVGLAGESDGPRERQKAWVANYDLTSYPGVVCDDGVEAIIETIISADEPVTLIAIGPLTNIAAALEREPAIAGRTRFVGMQGSVYKGYFGAKKIAPEFNVVQDIPACQKVFSSPWREMIVTPLDTCSLVKLTGEKYQTIVDCDDPLTMAVVETYRAWARAGDQQTELAQQSTVLYDTVAIYLAYAEDLLVTEELTLRIDDEGYMRIDQHGHRVRCAVEWKDLSAFEDYLVRVLT